MSGINRPTLASVERAGKNLAVAEMERIALAVGKSVADLLSESPDLRSDEPDSKPNQM
jgi:hypothetical protein